MDQRIILRAVLATALAACAAGNGWANTNIPAFRVACAAKAGATLSADALIDLGMKGKEFPMGETQSLRNFSLLLTNDYGLSKPLEGITEPASVAAIRRISLLISNNYVVGAQMALGVATLTKVLPREVSDRAGDMVFTATDPTDHDKDLMQVQRQLTQADQSFTASHPRVRAFARWILKGYAFNDPVAIDAAMKGYCQSSPTAQDNAALERWVAEVRMPQSMIDSARPNARKGPRPL